MNVLKVKLQEVLWAILPVTIVVILLHFTVVPLSYLLLSKFFLGTILIVLGLTVFLVGVDIGVTPVGNLIGNSIVKANKIWMLVLSGLALGFFISIAEPDLHILAGQIALVTSGALSKWLIIIVVSIGIAVLLTVGLFRIVYNLPLHKILTILYGIVFLLAIFSSLDFMVIAFDASGATTGAMTVPFILALAIGVSVLKKDSKASEKDSFGLVAIASVGPIVAILLLNIFLGQKSLGHVDLPMGNIYGDSFWLPFIKILPIVILEVLLALAPLVIIFMIMQKFSFKISQKKLQTISLGLFFSFLGLVLFLVGVNAGFMEVGKFVGYKVALMESKTYLIMIGFFLGLATVLAEPAVYVLTHQIEHVTSGYVRRKIVLMTLSIGIGVAVALSMLKIIVPAIQLWHYLLVGYVWAVIMMYFTPKIFVGMAFDAGGVASGPMTATFILAFAQGAAQAIDSANVLTDGFGMIALVALTPLIALQILGLIFKVKSRKRGVDNA